MGKLKDTLRDRYTRRAKREDAIRNALLSSNKRLEEDKRKRKRKIKTLDELECRLSVTNFQLLTNPIREPGAYVNRSHNLHKQLIGLIKHMYVKYRVPEFMYQAFWDDPDDPFNARRDLYQLWFVSLAQGGSFPKLVRGVMTSKEAHCFKQAPVYNRIHENVWWTKLIVAGVPNKRAQKLVDRFFTNYAVDSNNSRLNQVVIFFANQHARLSEREFDLISEFVGWLLDNEPEFKFSGRTASSMSKLAREWCRMSDFAKMGTFIQWQGLGLTRWQKTSDAGLCEIAELLTNRDLLIEGRTQRNCVYSYVTECNSGSSAIFSLRVYSSTFTGTYNEKAEPVYQKVAETSRVTIEVEPAKQMIIQVCARLNRHPSVELMAIVRRWARFNGLALPTWMS